MTATDELRCMLDERGVKYTQTVVTEGVLFTVVTSEERYFILVRDNDAGIEMWSQYFTPEQAIAATLGTGTCRDIGRYCFTCSECGWIADEPHHMLGGFQPRYCPNCGRRVVE